MVRYHVDNQFLIIANDTNFAHTKLSVEYLEMRNKPSLNKLGYLLRFDYDKRRDARKLFKDDPIPVSCKTIDREFNALIANASISGIFIETEEKLEIGKEIAIKFYFPDTKKKVMATGEVVRTDNKGVGIRIKIIFNK